MKIGMHATVCDTDTQQIPNYLYKPLTALGNALEGDYGGIMEHLWIDLELLERSSRTDGSPRYPFRFQKRVSGRSHFGLPRLDDQFNVGHYSVRPDFQLLKSLNRDEVVSYTLSLILDSFSRLNEKRKRIGELDVPLLQRRFREECEQLGYKLDFSAAD